MVPTAPAAGAIVGALGMIASWAIMFTIYGPDPWGYVFVAAVLGIGQGLLTGAVAGSLGARAKNMVLAGFLGGSALVIIWLACQILLDPFQRGVEDDIWIPVSAQFLIGVVCGIAGKFCTELSRHRSSGRRGA